MFRKTNNYNAQSSTEDINNVEITQTVSKTKAQRDRIRRNSSERVE